LLTARAVNCSGTIRLATTWQAASDISTPTTSMFAQALSADGQLLGQADGPPLGVRPDLLNLPVGWQMKDERTIGELAGQPQEVLVGLYDFAAGERLEARNAAGEPWPDNAVRLTLEDCP
jgi:hypothetical protein